MSSNSTKLDRAYRNESDVRVRERILLVIRISSDKQHIESVARELHRARSWAYKWCKRYSDEGLEGLRDRQRSGKPPAIPKEEMDKIKQELSDSNTGWDFRQIVMGTPSKRGLGSGTMKCTSEGCFTNGALNRVP